MTEQDKQALIEYYCQRDCGHTRKECSIDNCYEIMLIEEFPITLTDTDTISRQAAIDTVLKCYDNNELFEVYEDKLRALPSIQIELLTDKEQRIFLAAMGRERKVCKEVDDQYVHEPYEVLLTKVCDEIKRKVKKVLWT